MSIEVFECASGKARGHQFALLQSELHNFSSVAELHNVSGIAGNCRVLIIGTRRTLFNSAVLASAVKYPNVHRQCSIAKARGSSWVSRGLRLEVYCGGFSGGSIQRCRL